MIILIVLVVVFNKLVSSESHFFFKFVFIFKFFACDAANPTTTTSQRRIRSSCYWDTRLVGRSSSVCPSSMWQSRWHGQSVAIKNSSEVDTGFVSLSLHFFVIFVLDCYVYELKTKVIHLPIIRFQMDRENTPVKEGIERKNNSFMEQIPLCL